jgi:hypothetical protein
MNGREVGVGGVIQRIRRRRLHAVLVIAQVSRLKCPSIRLRVGGTLRWLFLWVRWRRWRRVFRGI